MITSLSRRGLAAAAAAALLLGLAWGAWQGTVARRQPTSCGETPVEAGSLLPEWSRLSVRLLAAAAAAVPAGAVPAASAQDDGAIQVEDPDRLRIVIDRYTQTLTLVEGDRTAARFPVAVGKPETPSPPGEWRVVHKDRGWGGGFGTRWLGLNVPWGIYGIHGTNKPWSIGRFASAGCIRMFNRDVERLWDVVPLKTPVTIMGDLPSVGGREEISEGVGGKFVMVLQFRLRQAGFDFGDMDARYGPATAEAVRDFQVLYGFEPTGTLTRDQQRLLWYPD